MSTYTGTASNDSINGGSGDDQINALGGNDVVNGNGGSDSIDGGDGDDQLRGGFSNDSTPPAGQIDGADILYGGAGNDVLRGQDGDDQLFGGSGDDNLRGDLGNDLLDGGDGSDFAAYRFDDIGAVAGVTFDASVVNSAPTVSLGDGRGGTDTLISIERVIVTGTAFNDTITTTTGADQITTVGGDDLVDAGAGDDVIIDYNGSSTLNGGDGDDRFDMVANGYFGGAGAGFDTLDGGAGHDLAQLFWGGVSSDVTVNLTDGSLSAVTADGGLSIAGANIEGVVVFSGSGNDSLTGGDANDVLSGGAGNDTLNGGAGDDELEGGAGNDTMDGGAGFDRYLLRLADQFAAGTVDASAFNVSGGVTTVSDGQGGTDTIANIEGVALSGGNFSDTLIGSAGGDTLNGGYGGDNIHGGDGDDLIIQDTLGVNFPTQPGVGQIAVTETADAINGGNGFDTVSYANVSSDMSVDLGLGTVTNGSTGNDTLVSIEAVATGSGADVIYGSGVDNRLEGGAGNDAIFGDSGNDNLLGGDGDDTLNGGAGDDQLYGGVGNDLLDGGTGADFMAGGAGDDVYIIDQAGGPGLAGDGVIEVAGEGVDEIRTFIDWGLGGIPDVENLTALGTANIFLGGNDGDNVLIGNEGNNYIVGEGGDDTIDGGGNAADGVNSGKDIASYQLPAGAVGDVVIVEGTGADAGKLLVQLVDGASVQTFLRITLNGPGDAIVEGVGIGAYMGADTVTNIEELHIFVRTSDGSPTPPNQFVAVNLAANQFGDFLAGSESADTLDLADYPGVINANGNRGDDVITGTDANNGLQGGAGNDTLSGLGGDDNLNGDDGEDVLEGGSGNDYMRGGAGDDTIDGGAGTNDIAAFNLPAGTPGSYRVVDGVGANAGKLIVERVDGATVETVFIVTLDGGQATVQGVGLAAHLGTDIVTNVDELHFLPDGPFDPSQFISISLSTRQFGEFVAGSEAADVIDLANFPGATNANGNRGDDVITGTAVNNSLQGGAGADTLNGLEGNDFLNGGNGTDTLSGDAGNDTLVGAADGDTLNGGDGDDVLIGAFNTGFGPQPGDGADVLRGEGGNDVLRGGDGDDLLEGGDGNDNLRGDFGSDTLDGGAGEDFASYFFTALNSGITFDASAVGASATSTIIDPSGGVDTLISIEKIGIGGTNFDDVLYGSEHLNPATGYANQMSGNAGDDQLYGGVGNDLLDGGTGADFLAGAGGSDTLIGGTGDDTLNGGDGDDFLVGDFGDDQIDGGAGALDRSLFYLDPATTGTLSVQVGSGQDAGKLLVIRTDGDFVETIAEVTSDGSQTIVAGVGSAAYLGVDTLSNVERLVFSILPPDPLQYPTMPGYAVIEVGATEGVVADGYVAGATVFVDNNRNGIFDVGEASAVTDVDGKFQLVTFGGGPILAIGGTNTDTGLANTVVLSAPSGSTVINPLTTLVQAVVDAGGLSVAAAQAQVTTALGLDPNISLLTTDLLASAAAGDPAALEAQKAAAIIVTLLEAATDAAGGVAGAEAAALAQIAAIIEDAPTGGVDLTNSATIEAVLEAAAPDAGDLGSAAAVLSATTTAIANAANLGDLADQQAAAMLTGNDLDNELVSGARGDQLTGAGGNDTLRGNGGDDTLLGGSGDDVLIGGDGFDRLYGGTGNDRFVIEGGTPLAGSKGNLAFDVIFDFDQTNDLLDFGSADLIDVRTYGNVNAAESSLGVELDGLAKQAKPKQFVTVAFGDSDGDGIADFAVAMIGAKSIGHDQIRFGQPAPDALAFTSTASSSGSRRLDAEVSGDAFVSLPDGETAFAFRMDEAFETFGTNHRKAIFGGGDHPHWALTSAPSPDGQPGDALFGHPAPGADPWA